MYVHDRIVSGIGWDGVLHLMIDWKSALNKSGKNLIINWKSALTKEWKQCPKKPSLTIYLITDWKKWPQIHLKMDRKKVASEYYIGFFSPRGNTKE